ncbi:DUF805 domain-containing protein [Megalodesulfovibrio paquesii]
MDFTTSIKTCFGKYATFKGRASRAEFWYWALFVWLLSLAAMAVDTFLANGASPEPGMQLCSTLVSLATMLPGLAVTVRRLHDVNRSGWWFLVAFTVVGCLLLLYWAVMPSKDDGNRY